MPRWIVCLAISATVGASCQPRLPAPSAPPDQTVTYSIDVLQHAKVDTRLGSWCADKAIADGYTCVDGLIGTNDWPDKAVLCVDQLRPDLCVRLGDLRAWVTRYQQRLYTQ